MKNSDYNFYDYQNWYVLFVQTDKEYYIKQLIDKYSDYSYKTVIFSRDLVHINQHKKKHIKKSLFPGYIFIHKHVDTILDLSRKILPHYFIKPISFNGKPSRVEENEMMLLLENSDDNGVFNISNYYKEQDEVVIIDGPLKNLRGKIKFINEKKQKINIEISLFNRVMNLSLGINEIKK